MAWAHVTPNEDYEILATRQIEGGAEAVRDICKEVEATLPHSRVIRIMDPNMGLSPSGATRELTWQREFDNVGLHFDLADDSSVGRARLNDFIKPDPQFMRSRFRVDPSCEDFIFQMKRYVWADHKNAENKDISQVPMQKHDDYPALAKYLMNYLPTGEASAPAVHRRDRGVTQPERGRYGRR